jgi:hypothetical protein
MIRPCEDASEEQEAWARIGASEDLQTAAGPVPRSLTDNSSDFHNSDHSLAIL